MVAEAKVTNTRMAARDAVLDAVWTELNGRGVFIEGGALDGVEVISLGHAQNAIDEVRRSELPELRETTAEVHTPATVIVVAGCPKCGLDAFMAIQITPVLTVDADGGELKLKAKASTRAHVCGQLPLVVSDEDQVSFELEDITGETEPSADDETTYTTIDFTAGDPDALLPDDGPTAQARNDADPCPFPDCLLPGGHRGKHDPIKPGDEA